MNQQYSTIVKEIIEELESRNPLPPLSPTEEWSSRLDSKITHLGICLMVLLLPIRSLASVLKAVCCFGMTH